jgi:hypothetical protein
MRLLSLFDGTGSICKPFVAAGWECQRLDIDGRHGATIVTDIRHWDYNIPAPDVIFAGVPCEQYSSANTRGKRRLAEADELVTETWAIIQHFLCLNPALIWAIENPDSSLLWRRAVALPLHPQLRWDHCAYGALFRKRTRLATNLAWTPRPLCDPKVCASCENGKHRATAQRGPQRGCTGDVQSLDTLHAYPAEFAEEFYQACARQTWTLL